MKTEKITLRGKGTAIIKKLHPDGPGIRIAKEFLDKLATGCVEYAVKYMSVIDEAPFTFLERQSGGMVASALANFADTFLMEVPISRKHKKEKNEKYGWVDFWAYYREYDFFIELKQSYYSLYSNKINQEITDSWSLGCDQIASCTQESFAGYCATNKAIFLSFQIIPMYITLKPDKELNEYVSDENLASVHSQLTKNLAPSPSWSYLWKMKEDITMNTYRFVGESNRYYPAVIFLSRIETMSFPS